jgi:hypothetical protein
MPIRLLARDRFDPGPALATLKQPKLFLLPPDASATAQRDARVAADPKMAVYLPVDDRAAKSDALRRFLDELSRR